jgi:hypothetical protein
MSRAVVRKLAKTGHGASQGRLVGMVNAMFYAAVLKEQSVDVSFINTPLFVAFTPHSLEKTKYENEYCKKARVHAG